MPIDTMEEKGTKKGKEKEKKIPNLTPEILAFWCAFRGHLRVRSTSRMISGQSASAELKKKNKKYHSPTC